MRSYLDIKILLIGFFLLVSSGEVFAQQKLFGTVTGEQGEALFGATIFVHELGKGTVSGEDGTYRIQNLKKGTYHLHVTYVGYESHTQTVFVNKESNEVNFQLKPSPLEMKELIVESDPFKTGPVEQSMSMELVNKDFLEKNSGNTFVNSLEKIPGVNSVNTGVGISKPVIRGMTGNRVIVADRGVKQEGQQWGTDHGLEIDQFDPERVEIIKGPASLLYGSDGIAGVVNILPPVLPHDGEWSAEWQSVYKSNNQLSAHSAMVEGSKGDFGARLRVSAQDFGDYRVPAESFTYQGYQLSLLDGRLKNTAGQERNFSLMGGVKKNWGQFNVTISNYHQKAGLFAGATGVPRSYQLEPDGDSRNIDVPRQVNNHLKVIAATKVLFRRNWLEAELGYQRNHRKEEAKPHSSGSVPAEFGVNALGLDLHTLSANLKYFQHQREGHKRITGMQLQFQDHKRDGFEFLLPDYQSYRWGAFWFEELTFGDQLTVNAGLRSDFGKVSIEAYEQPYYVNQELVNYFRKTYDLEREFFSLSGALGASYYPSHTFNAKLNLGSSFRFPSPAELAMNGLHHGTFRYERGDSTLKAERGWQADVSLNWHDEKLMVSLTPFFNYFDNFLYLGATSEFASSGPGTEAFQLYRYKQTNAVMSGLESSVEYHLLDELHLGLTYEYVWNLNLESGLPLPMTPPFSVKSEVAYDWPVKTGWIYDIFTNLNVQYTGAQNRVDRNERTTEGYTLLNFTTGFTAEVFRQPVVMQLALQNLTNQRYMNHLSRYRLLNLPEQGRNINVSLKVPIGHQKN